MNTEGSGFDSFVKSFLPDGISLDRTQAYFHGPNEYNNFQWELLIYYRGDDNVKRRRTVILSSLTVVADVLANQTDSHESNIIR